MLILKVSGYHNGAERLIITNYFNGIVNVKKPSEHYVTEGLSFESFNKLLYALSIDNLINKDLSSVKELLVTVSKVKSRVSDEFINDLYDNLVKILSEDLTLEPRTGFNCLISDELASELLINDSLIINEWPWSVFNPWY